MPKSPIKRKAPRPVKRHRLVTRITDEQQELFKRAADLQGRTLSDFVLATVHEKAVQTIESMQAIRLNEAESLAMTQALLNPRKPNAKLQAAAEHYYANFEAK